MDLTAYLHPGWAPLIRPAPASRAWMDATPESFAYRCLPLNIANAHGWEILSPCTFDACWSGGTGTEAVTIRLDGPAERAPVSLFGQGVLTFHVEAILRTPPGWNLWIGGSPNRAKDGIAPLTGIVETDWSPFSFTMNWRFTRAHHWVHFDALEPFCFFFPVARAATEAFEPAFAPLADDPATATRFREWSEARDAFHARMARDPPATPSARWQKHYYRGVDVAGEALVDDHRAKLRLHGFDRSKVPDLPIAPGEDAAAPAAPAEAPPRPSPIEDIKLALAKRNWLLRAQERQRALAPRASRIERRTGMAGDEFLELYYAQSRPVILTGEMQEWPALERWTPAYLREKIGAAEIEYQGDRTARVDFEIDKAAGRRRAPFDRFIDMIRTSDAGNDAYLTAYNSARNEAALAPLAADMGFLDAYLTRATPAPLGMMWIGPAGTLTPLHHDLTNNFVAQIVGRKRIRLLPASEAGKLYNRRAVFSDVADLDDPTLDRTRFADIAGARAYDILLEPGEILFIPFGWWHQVNALEFAVTSTYTNFRWPNDASLTYPVE